MNDSIVQLGLDSFGDISTDRNGNPNTAAQEIRNHLDHAEIADRAGVDAISFGEHHRGDFAISAPDMVLAAAASRTERITLGTAVTVLSSDDPIRVFERFSTLNALSNGRAEITVGRGSFTESFPLFGFDLADYDVLFEEKFEMFAELLTEPERFSWSGTHRRPVENAVIMPRTEGGLKAWVGVGGSPQSVVRAVTHGVPMMLAIIGGDPRRFQPYVDLYRDAQNKLEISLPLGVHSPGHIAETDAEARDQVRDAWIDNRNRIGRERGWGPTSAAEFESEADHGSMYVGSPDTVARKIADTVSALGVDRFDLKYSNGPVREDHLRRSVELYGTEVIPRVRALLAQ
ncbi:LLM class flavin-dependent oxidoreductase [Calidifontibacter terrae]